YYIFNIEYENKNSIGINFAKLNDNLKNGTGMFTHRFVWKLKFYLLKLQFYRLRKRISKKFNYI
ncbi:MAG: hypothetical protein D6813_05455, partial [Calditrichaeota bacterium]